MATVNACVLGDPQLQTVEAATVADLRSKMELDGAYAVLVRRGRGHSVWGRAFLTRCGRRGLLTNEGINGKQKKNQKQIKG